MPKHIKDADWKTVAVVAAGNLSHTFGSTTHGTQTYYDTKGAIAVEFRLKSATLGTAGELRITPKFKAADGTTTNTPADGSVNIYYPLVTAGTSTEPFTPVDAVWTTAELWTDVAAGGTGAAEVQIKRIYPT